MKKAFIVGEYIRYFLLAKNGKGHGIHSPFVFDFVKNVLNNSRKNPDFQKINQFRSSLLHSKEFVIVEDFGAGSHKTSSAERRVSDIAKYAGRTPKYGQLLYSCIRYWQPNKIIELGTSLGIGTAYIAMAAPRANIVSLEGSRAIAELAQKHVEQLSLQHVKIVVGNFDDTLMNTLQEMVNVDVLYIDGNHRYEPTLRYFQWALPYIHDYSVMIFDDIHWSAEMLQAWKEIIKHPSVTLSIDLFQFGLVFFRKDFIQKQHFTIRY